MAVGAKTLAQDTMTIAALYNISRDPDTLAAFTFANADHHFLVRNAIQAQKGITLIPYIMDPVPPFDVPEFMRRHQQSHFDNNAALSLASNDISSIPFDNAQQLEGWIQLHIQEHINWSNVLRVF